MNVIKTLTIVVVLALLTACIPTSELYRGKKAASEHVVTLQPGERQVGQWKTFDMVFDYSYQIDGNILEIDVSGALGQHYQMMYFWVKDLSVYLYLVDRNNIVLDTILLPENLRHTNDKFSVKRYLKLTESTAGFSFGYRGKTYEFDSHTSFSHKPW